MTSRFAAMVHYTSLTLLNRAVVLTMLEEMHRLTSAVEGSFTRGKIIINAAMVNICKFLLDQFVVKAILALLLDWVIHVAATSRMMSMGTNLAYVVYFITGLQYLFIFLRFKLL